MKKTIMLFPAVCAIGFLAAGCGHNTGAAFSGKMVNVGYDPEFNKFGLQYYDGVFVSGLNKEHTETHLTFTDSAESESRLKTSSSMMYRHRTGDQVTGYTVELAEAEMKRSVPGAER